MHGEDEGCVCGREGCAGILEYTNSENCSCHISPPCSSCCSVRLRCPECDWERQDESEPETTQAEKDCWAKWAQEQQRLHDAPLDNTKVSWRDKAHSSCSMIKEGVYPEGATLADVRKLVDGTFGGRFDHFGDGRFRFIAYTD